ncbi:hypothetical protein C0993_008188 [Termitomyces sp. T159_Od127]|nr:hypothetical protein C0993_008188 [Termitomyces sp. T159_Od127]
MSLHGRRNAYTSPQCATAGSTREGEPSGAASQTFSGESIENPVERQTRSSTEPRGTPRSPTPEAAQLSDKEKQILDELEIIKSDFGPNFARQALTNYVGLLDTAEKKERMHRKRAAQRKKAEKRDEDHPTGQDDLGPDSIGREGRGEISKQRNHFANEGSDIEKEQSISADEYEGSDPDRGESKVKRRKVKDIDFPW